MTDERNPRSEAAEPAQSIPVDPSSSGDASDSEVPSDSESLRQDVADLKDRLLRTQAEMENFRRRSANESNEARKYRSLAIVRDLVPVMDNLDRAVASAEQTGDVNNLLEGIRMVAQQLADTLKAHGTEPIAPEGEPFDPNFHEALSQVPSADYPPMTVIQVVETGFRMHDRVVRPARVIVSCAPPEPTP